MVTRRPSTAPLPRPPLRREDTYATIEDAIAGGFGVEPSPTEADWNEKLARDTLAAAIWEASWPTLVGTWEDVLREAARKTTVAVIDRDRDLRQADAVLALMRTTEEGGNEKLTRDRAVDAVVRAGDAERGRG